MGLIPEQAERACREEYSSGAVYRPESISVLPGDPADRSYSEELLNDRLELVQRHCTGPRLLDLCCGNGLHLSRLFGHRALPVGLDFSLPFLAYAREYAAGDCSSRASFVCASAMGLPFRSGCFDGVYSISALMHIPDIAATFAEVARVLAPGGAFVFDLGNRVSLNEVVCRQHPETARCFNMPVGEMLRQLGRCGLTVVEHRAYQILPMWGGSPRWMRPLLHPRWTTLLKRRVAGRMLDEWLSSLPGLNRLAFRHVFACRKEGC
jgi:ubiquinone/menaquinone biosynthesis C-methylase UbiE